MSKLIEYYFSDLYDMSSGISTKPEQAGHGHKFISFRAVFNNYYLPEYITELMDSDEAERKQYSVKEGDIFLTRTSEVVDELGMSCVATRDYPDTTFSGFLKRLRPKQLNITYHKYLAFYLRSKYFRKTMSNNAIMTLRASLNEQIFSYLKLILPSFSDQVKIGDLLFSLSEKIELNNKINAELEAMAKTLYDYWFVQFDFPDENGKSYKSSGGKMVYDSTLKREIPEGWEVKSISHVAVTSSGGTQKSTIKEFYEGGKIPWINSGELNNPFIISTGNFITELGMKNSSAKLFPKNSILVAMYGATAGKVSFLKIEATTNQAICALIPKKEYYNYYLKFCIEDLYKYLVNLSSGSARDNLSQDKIKNLSMLLPKNELLLKFYEVLHPIYEKYYLNSRQNEELESLRDWLLPMLMNGQVSVGKAYEQVDEVLNLAAEGA